MRSLTTLLVVFLTAPAGGDTGGRFEIQPLPALEQAISNNAVALVPAAAGDYLYSFTGLGRGKTWRDISAGVMVLEPGADRWKVLETVPGPAGRLAAAAVSAAGSAWLFGGYTVAEDGSEVSTPGVYRISPGERIVRRVTDMPVPVDDTVALVYQDRYIFLVSGWHDLGNVNLVQVLDVKTLQWAQATPWPGAPVFGHAGGLAAGKILVCDGVKIDYPGADAPRKFLPSNECWLGLIDAQNFRRIDWRPAAAHPGAPRYRMAATAAADDHVVFAGGARNPYNFDGVGYNGEPATPESSVLSYRFSTARWRSHGELPHGSMDHRGLPHANGWFHLIGGMRAGQTPVAEALRFRLDDMAIDDVGRPPD